MRACGIIEVASTPLRRMSISVIIPAYNRATLLPATLDAVLAQTLPPDEVIVVDDGSIDDTAAVARGYAPRVRCLTIANGGDLVARNAGMAAARGSHVAFCDSDDVWRPGFLAAMRSLWEAEPRTRAAFSDFVALRAGVWEQATKFAAAPRGFWDDLRPVGAEMGVFDAPVVRRLTGFQPCFPSCLMAERDFFTAIGGWDEGASRIVGSDFATALRLAEHTPLGVIRVPLVGIRRHEGNFSADTAAMNLGDARILEYVLATRPTFAPYAEAIRASIAERRHAALDALFARRDFAAVRQIAGLLEHPAVMARIKAGAAALPPPLRGPTAALLLGAGTLRGRLRARMHAAPPKR